MEGEKRRKMQMQNSFHTRRESERESHRKKQDLEKFFMDRMRRQESMDVHSVLNIIAYLPNIGRCG